MPSNEVYSIVQDKKGFIWIGCDAGLFKFDGVRYTAYKCNTQNSKSISNLTPSKDGKIYGINFQDQIFYLENDSLKELIHAYHKLSNIATDQNGNLYINHFNGISVFNSITQEWRNVSGISDFTRSVDVNEKNDVYFLTQKGFAKIDKGETKIYDLSNSETYVASSFLLVCHQNEVWAFKRDGSVFYLLKNGQVIKNQSEKLLSALQNKKITRLKYLPDGNLWICTYNGICRYDTQKDSAQLLYPNIAFSDVLIDRENNYWFTTLQTGVFRVPNLDYWVWNSTNEQIKNDKLSHIATDGTHIYFSSINGAIGKLNSQHNLLQTFHTGKNADVECLVFDTNNESLVFSLQNKIYTLKNDKISIAPFQKNAPKSIVHIPPFYFWGSSLGLYAEGENYNEKISEDWTRQLAWNRQKQTLYAATNKGLQLFTPNKNKWICTDTLFENTQIVSIDFDENTQQLFTLTFDGKIQLVAAETNTSEIALLPDDVQANKLKHTNGNLFIASNKGVWIFNLANKKWNHLNALSGLTSDNVQDLLLLKGNLWIATGRGLQKIPLKSIFEKPLAKIYLKNSPRRDISLNYGKSLILLPEVAHYSSNGQFKYAYRINQQAWIKLPAGIEQIEIQNLPAGNFEMELKAIDYLGRDSENNILVSGYVKPPIYKTWWFILLLILLIGIFIFWIVKKRIQQLKQKQQKEIEHITLENELRLTQQSALKAQMNPHFIFNVLNSIKGYIYENDKKNAALYLSRFSELIRKILEQSSVSNIKLSEEIETLKLYIELEAMLLDNSFSCSISIAPNINPENLYIPAMLIQPLVENALKHGLRHKQGEKKLIIAICINQNNLLISVEDNGIGRVTASKINQQSYSAGSEKKHHPFASEALSKRIKLHNAEHLNSIGLEIIDLTNEQGTKAILNININERKTKSIID